MFSFAAYEHIGTQHMRHHKLAMLFTAVEPNSQFVCGRVDDIASPFVTRMGLGYNSSNVALSENASYR